MAAVLPQEAIRILQVCGVRRHQYTLAMARPEHTVRAMRRADREVWQAYKRMLGDAPEADMADGLIARQAALPGVLGGAGLTAMVAAADRTHVAARANSLAILAAHLGPDITYKLLKQEIECIEDSQLPWAISLRAAYDRVTQELEDHAGQEDTPAARALALAMERAHTPDEKSVRAGRPRSDAVVEESVRLASAELPALMEFADAAGAEDEAPARGLLGVLSKVAYQAEWMTLWNSMDEVGRARLGSATGQGGGMILCIEATSPAVRLPPDQYVLAARRLLGLTLPCCASVMACAGCGVPLESQTLAGLHFPVCPGPCEIGAGRTDLYGLQIVHAALTRGAARVLDDSGSTPVLEPAHLLGDDFSRPADVAVLDYTESNVTLAVDVSCARIITSGRVTRAAQTPGAALADAETRKRATYATALAAAPQVHFVPLIMDEYGHMGPSGGAFLAGLAERTALRRVTGLASMESVGTITKRLIQRWQGFMAAELHGAMARVTMLLARRAQRGGGQGP